MKLTKTHFAAVCCLILAACTPADTGASNAPPTKFIDADPAGIAAGIAAEINSITGENLGRGTVFRNATANGSDLTMELRLNQAANGISDNERRRASSAVERGLRNGICEGEAFRALLASGGTVEIGLFGRDNGLIDTFTYDRPCR